MTNSYDRDSQYREPRELKELADKLLKDNQCRTDGRPIGSVSKEQAYFEYRMKTGACSRCDSARKA